ncbi:hypothetical protein GCM10027567_18270 [Spongiibacter taiwanensis]|nr:hypothetical protein [Spongiibacter taiwanensis]
MSQEKLQQYVENTDAFAELAAKYSLLLGVTAALVACLISLV